MGTQTPILSRLEAIRARRDNPTPRIVQLYPSEPTRLSPFVKAAREKRLKVTAIGYAADCDCGGAA